MKRFIPWARAAIVGAPELTRVERVARVLAVICGLWFFLAAAWGMFGPPLAGHYASMAATAIIGENMIHWKIGGAIWAYLPTHPNPSDYYCHHPFGAFWASALAYLLFGHHDWVIPFPSIVMSALMPLLVYGIAKDRWGVIAAASAVAGYALLPITASFADFHGLETGVAFGCALFYWGHARFLTTWKTRYMLASIFGAFVAVSYDWPGYIAVGIVLGWGLVRAFLLPLRWFEKIEFAKYARWWAFSAAVAVASLVFIVGFFSHVDKIGDWLASGEMRGNQAGAKLADVLKARVTWIDIMFTPLAILLGKIAAPICALRLIWYRRDQEIYAPATLVMAVLQYVAFKRGADVHIFWPHAFGLYFSLAFAELVATFIDVPRALLAKLNVRKAALVGASVGLTLTAAFTLVMFPDVVRAVKMGRETSGRFNNNGSPIRSEGDFDFAEEVLSPKIPKDTVVDIHPTASVGWDQIWILHRTTRAVGEPPPPGPANEDHPFYIARPSGMGPDAQKKMASNSHVRIYGDAWIIDEREPKALVDAYSLHEHEPNLFQWYFVTAAEPARYVYSTPDPFLTWEWRTHLGQPADVPTAAPGTLDEFRIAYNIAISTGDAARAAELRKTIDAQIDHAVTAQFDQGMRIIGTRVTHGVQPTLETWFEAVDGPAKGDAFFGVRSAMVKKEPWSLIPLDTVERDMAFAAPISAGVWKRGFLYVVSTPLMHRIGTEKYWGAWQHRDASRVPVRVDHEPVTQLLVIR